MTKALTFYHNPMSRAAIVRWMLEEVGASYETVLLDYEGAMKTPEYLAINPMGKIPAIRHGDIIVTECAAICAYLAEAFPQAGLAPRDDAERGPYYRWLFFAAGPVEAAINDRALGLEIPAERERMVGYGNYDRVVDVLDGFFRENDYIAGNRFTAADVYLGSHLIWGSRFGMLPRRESFDAYIARLSSRPAAIRARELDEKLMPAQA